MDFGRDCSAVIGCRVSGSVVYTNASSGAVLAAHGGMALDLRHTAYDAAVEYHRCRLLAVGAMERAAVLTEPSAAVAALESALQQLQASPVAGTSSFEGVAALIADLQLCIDSGPSADFFFSRGMPTANADGWIGSER